MSEHMHHSEDGRSWKQHPEAQAYRTLMATALQHARVYDGSEESFRGFIKTLEALEEQIQASPPLKETDGMSREIEAAYAYAPTRPRDINNLLLDTGTMGAGNKRNRSFGA